jgi:hypothetical protein
VKNFRGAIAMLLALAVVSVRPASVAGQSAQSGETDASADRKTNLEAFLKDAQTYAMTLQTAQPGRVELLPQPVMNWNGSAFVWLKDGRPEVIGTFWRSTDRNTGRPRWPHAFHSLSEHPITAHFDERPVWNPKTPGLQFRPVEGTEQPADKSWRRLAQMRALAREFSVAGIYGRLDDTTRRPLRLLTQPVFRYEPPGGIVRDGAIFAYSADVVVTDPDALLILEARQANGQLRWEYAFARFHFVELTGYHRDQQVWKVESSWPETRQHVFGADPDRDNIYYSVTRP